MAAFSSANSRAILFASSQSVFSVLSCGFGIGHRAYQTGARLHRNNDEVYDVKLAYGPFRIAALEDDIVIKYGPRR
jgi:hypothetical protein